jgi:hypothetical protein
MAYRYKTVKVNGKTKLLHRHLVEQRLGRPLARHEHVHHRNGDTWDNSDDNLEVLTSAEHQHHHKQKHPLTKTCVMCNTVFTPHPTKRARNRTCSWKCGHALSRLSAFGKAPPFPQVAEALVAANVGRRAVEGVAA